MREDLRMKTGPMPAERELLRRRPPGQPRFRGFVFLVLGGLLAIATSIFTLFHLDDHHVIRATVPGFLLALGMFVAFFMRNRSEACNTPDGDLAHDRWESR